MRLSTFLTIKGLISLVFGLGLVIVPAEVGKLYGMKIDDVSMYLANFLGGMMVCVGMACLLFRRMEGDAARALTMSFFVGDAVACLAGLVYQLKPVATTTGWVNVILFFLLAAGLAYYRFVRYAK